MLVFKGKNGSALFRFSHLPCPGEEDCCSYQPGFHRDANEQQLEITSSLFSKQSHSLLLVASLELRISGTVKTRDGDDMETTLLASSNALSKAPAGRDHQVGLDFDTDHLFPIPYQSPR